ncbi:MAG: SGNH/GDSL hydrolase family protein [Bacteroidetes bacterium]|nr:MAG: SGNH/GDSL hydrolase family protein [Bacteroidota bacterium]
MMFKKVAFTLASVALPFLVLLLLEAGLRGVGVKASERTAFEPVPGHADHQVFNPAYAARYFQGFRPSVAYNPFRREKAEGTFRVFVLGGSSAAGFPYHFYYAFPERLAQRLVAVGAGSRIEVVNLGMTAVNSYTLWDLAGLVAEQEPDAVLIYAGHNEYYGAFGAGSTIYALGNRPLLKRLLLRLKHSVLYLLLEDLLTPDVPEETTDRTMMARVVRDAGIAPGGEVFRAGIAQFEANMADVIERFREAGIPVYLGTLTSNLRDQPPLGEDAAAQAAYEEGRRWLVQGDTLRAREAFERARELDPIRFRAPGAINEVIRRLAAAPGVTLVPVDEVFRRHSPGGLEGKALFDDHLHPNARGYDLMAEAFFEAMRPALVAAEEEADVRPLAPDPYEQALVDLQLARLKGGYPFEKRVTPEEANRRFTERLQHRRRAGYADSLAVLTITRGYPPPEALLTAFQTARARRDTLTALHVAYGLLAWQPFNRALKDQAVGLAVARERPEEVVPALLRMAVRTTYTTDHLNALAAVELRHRRLGVASHWLAEVEHRDPGDPVMLYNRARLLVLQGDTLAARAYYERYREAVQSR